MDGMADSLTNNQVLCLMRFMAIAQTDPPSSWPEKTQRVFRRLMERALADPNLADDADLQRILKRRLAAAAEWGAGR